MLSPHKGRNFSFGSIFKLPSLLTSAWRHVCCRRHWEHRVAVPHSGSRVPEGHYDKLPRRRTTGLFRSSQWGSATIPYRGAKVNVPVLSGNKKVSSWGASWTSAIPEKLIVDRPVTVSDRPQTHAQLTDPHLCKSRNCTVQGWRFP